MEAWLEQRRVKNDNPQNGEEAALSRAGPELYEKIFKYYTKKQVGFLSECPLAYTQPAS
jgi:UDP-galactopyranose mutase